MKASELRGKTDSELREALLDLRRKQFNLRMQTASGQPVRTSEIRETRKDIARVKTIVEERNQDNAA